jgi:hypothetical protein
LIQRDDDKEETVRKRLEGYQKMTQPVLQFYRYVIIITFFNSDSLQVLGIMLEFKFGIINDPGAQIIDQNNARRSIWDLIEYNLGVQ